MYRAAIGGSDYFGRDGKLTKELRALLQQQEQLRAQIRALLGEDKLEEAEKLKKDFDAIGKKIALLKELEGDDDTAVDMNESTPKADKDLEKEYGRIFMAGLRKRKISAEDRSVIREYTKVRAAVMHEGNVVPEIPDGDSSLIVPQDLQTQINKIMRELNDLSAFVRTETVATLSGSRVLEKDEDMTPFAVVDEYGEIQETDNPKFVSIPYKLIKRAGFLPLTNELLRDTDQNIRAYVANWLARKHVVTKNSLIRALLASLTPKAVADVKALKKIINVDLDPALARTGMILTNQDGYNWLDEQEDNQGRPLLQPDITQPGKKLFKGLPVEPMANRHLPSDTTSGIKAPFYVGNFKQFAVLFTWGIYQLASTTEGGDAWRRDTTELRAITRDDARKWDDAAVKFAQVTIS